jgi:hypothetical protein
MQVLAGCLKSRGPSSSRPAAEHAGSAARWAAYEVLCALCELPGPSGIRAVFGCAPIASSLLAGQLSEDSKQGREAAFAVVLAALGNSQGLALLGEPLSGQLRRAAAAGPFALTLEQATVTTAGSNAA